MSVSRLFHAKLRRSLAPHLASGTPVHTTLCLRRNRDGSFTYVPPLTTGFGMPEQIIHLNLVGEMRVLPPQTEFVPEELAAWLRALRREGFEIGATNDRGNPLPVNL